MLKKLLLFDVDGTLTETGEKIQDDMVNLLIQMHNAGYELGIVGGGKLEKILEQLDNKVFFRHYFSECGCVYNLNIDINNLELKEIYCKNIRKHQQYNNINKLVKLAINFISNVDYTITGNFIDLRNGIIYISLIGMSANQDERKYFLELDKVYKYREKLLNMLIEKAKELRIKDYITVTYGGSVGIGIYPKEYDKEQIIQHLNISNYSIIYYFGDKYLEDGNDYKLLNNKYTVSRCVDSVDQTKKYLNAILNK